MVSLSLSLSEFVYLPKPTVTSRIHTTIGLNLAFFFKISRNTKVKECKSILLLTKESDPWISAGRPEIRGT